MLKQASGIFYTNSKENDYPRLGRRSSVSGQELWNIRKENLNRMSALTKRDHLNSDQFEELIESSLEQKENDEIAQLLSTALQEKEMERGM